ncbi:MAG: glycosyltransferase [Gemmatimonadetes bacterium]|nr:glycosyltransferase family 4 protein [Gemmatimonadota bacterium]NIR78813.1 glycosyltransferase family 4 protein [Gemmatimonadota bacterium]NIT88082.1 glycosyltransferase family 4 protein [Gemmatimonadota bacterium]NIU31912.1 glycosyltransferase family 4 protein [Gemmatimonadota bacterium]NIU36007.1 glycosyltransferase [Gemmatimonadota bacterium]
MDLHIAYAFDNRVPSPQADTEQLVSTVAALSRRGLDVTLVIPRLGEDPGAGKGAGKDAAADEIRRFYGVEGAFAVARYPCPRGPRPLQKLVAPLRAVRAGAAREADLIHTRNLPIALAGIGAGRRVVLETYRPWPDQFAVLRPLIRRLMGHGDFVGAILHSRLARESYARLGVPEERLLVAHNGWEPSRMEPVLERGEARERLELPRERPIVVYTGRVDDEKGLDVVLEVASLAPEVLFVLVGAKEPDAFTERARRADNVRLVPWQPFEAVSRWLYAADVLLLPPSARPLERHGSTVLPMKLFSYLAAGRPILAPRTPDVTEVLRDGENARLVPPGDAEAAAAAVGEILEDGALRERLADGGRRAAEGLTWDARAERIHRFLARRLEAMEATAPPTPPPAPR